MDGITLGVSDGGPNIDTLISRTSYMECLMWFAYGGHRTDAFIWSASYGCYHVEGFIWRLSYGGHHVDAILWRASY